MRKDTWAKKKAKKHPVTNYFFNKGSLLTLCNIKGIKNLIFLLDTDNMLTISLEQLHFHAAIGLYPEEKILGNDFMIDLHIHLDEGNKPIDELSHTVDYVKAYALIENEMQQAHRLMETVAQNCLQTLKATWPQITGAEITIRKLHPPMKGEIGHSKITLSKKF